MSVAYISPNDMESLLSEADNRLFRRISAGFLVLTLVFGVIVPNVNLPPIEREVQEQLPPQLTRVIEQKIELPEPEPAPPPEPEPEPEPEEQQPEPPTPVEPEPAPVEPVPEPEPVVTEAQVAEQARAKAKESGLMAFSDDLAQMRDSLDLNSLADDHLVEGTGAAAETERDIITADATATSGGIDTSHLSQDAGGGNQLAGRKTTEYQAPEEGMPSVAQQAQRTAEVAIGSRSQESIRKVFDQNKGAVYAIYRRALRQDPSLQGKVTIHIVIAPDGSVTSCEILSSELEHPETERKLLARIKLINFGADEVTPTELNYSFNFLPF